MSETGIIRNSFLSYLREDEWKVMKDLVVFYSWTGNTRVVASALAAKTGANLKEIEEVKPRKKIIGFIT